MLGLGARRGLQLSRVVGLFGDDRDRVFAPRLRLRLRLRLRRRRRRRRGCRAFGELGALRPIGIGRDVGVRELHRVVGLRRGRLFGDVVALEVLDRRLRGLGCGGGPDRDDAHHLDRRRGRRLARRCRHLVVRHHDVRRRGRRLAATRLDRFGRWRRFDRRADDRGRGSEDRALNLRTPRSSRRACRPPGSRRSRYRPAGAPTLAASGAGSKL